MARARATSPSHWDASLRPAVSTSRRRMVPSHSIRVTTTLISPVCPLRPHPGRRVLAGADTPEGRPPGRPSAFSNLEPLAGALHRAGIPYITAVEVVVAQHGRVARGRVDRLQQRAVLAGGAPPEIVNGPGDEVATFLPCARAVGFRRGVERVERRTVRRVNTIRPGGPVAERRVVL